MAQGEEAGLDPELRKAVHNFTREAEAPKEYLPADELLASGDYDALARAAELLICSLAPQLSHLHFGRALVRKVIILGDNLCTKELQRALRRVEILEEERATNGRAYLQEMSALRSKLRNVDEERVSFEDAEDAETEYYWDALSTLPEETRQLAQDVIAEKLKCFSSQRVRATLSEFRSARNSFCQQREELEASWLDLTRALNSSQAETDHLRKELELQARQVREKEQAVLDEYFSQQRIRTLETHLESRERTIEDLKREMEGLKEMADEGRMWRLERERDELFHIREVRAEQDKIHEAAVRLAEQTEEAMKAHLRRRPSKSKDAESQDMKVPPLLTEFIEFPQSANRRQGDSMHERLLASTTHIIDQTRELFIKKTEKVRKASIFISNEADELRLQVQDLTARLATSQSDLANQRHKHVASEIKIQEVEAKLQEYIEDFDVSESPEYQKMVRRNTLLEETAVDNSQLLHEAETCKKENDDLKESLREAEASQLHPARVAALRAELREVQYEYKALLNANAALREALEGLVQQLREAVVGRAEFRDEAVMQVLVTCERTVHNRLYEDALRRHDRLAQNWRSLQVGLLSADEAKHAVEAQDETTSHQHLEGCGSLRRCRSIPARLRQMETPPDIKNMLLLNARGICRLYGRAEPLLDLPRRSPTPDLAPAVVMPTPVVVLNEPKRPHSAPNCGKFFVEPVSARESACTKLRVTSRPTSGVSSKTSFSRPRTPARNTPCRSARSTPCNQNAPCSQRVLVSPEPDTWPTRSSCPGDVRRPQSPSAAAYRMAAIFPTIKAKSTPSQLAVFAAVETAVECADAVNADAMTKVNASCLVSADPIISADTGVALARPTAPLKPPPARRPGTAPLSGAAARRRLVARGG